MIDIEAVSILWMGVTSKSVCHSGVLSFFDLFNAGLSVKRGNRFLVTV